ncbi:MAG TPA: nucleotidyltransferase domain-containing protein, partial [Gaiellaceae bacterium]
MVPGLDPALLERVVARLRELEPQTVAILVSGSYAKGTADEQSDLDLVVVTGEEPSSPYRMWFEERPDSSALHVSPGWRTLERCVAERAQAEDWALGFPVHNVTRYVWATEVARARLGDPPDYVHPAAGPELEDFVEFLAKVRRSLRS